MADSKLTALTELTGVTGSDLTYVVDDPGGTPISKKATVDNVFTGRTISAETAAGSTITLTSNAGSIAGASCNTTLHVTPDSDTAAITLTDVGGTSTNYKFLTVFIHQPATQRAVTFTYSGTVVTYPVDLFEASTLYSVQILMDGTTIAGATDSTGAPQALRWDTD